jgi:hypothetical protein
VFAEKPIMFGDFMKMGAEKSEQFYEEITNYDKLRSVLTDVSAEYKHDCQTFCCDGMSDH